MDEKDKAVLEMFRHYSGMRFLMLPLFFTAMGGLAFCYWTLLSTPPVHKSLVAWVALSGALVSSLFAIYEYSLSGVLFRISSLFPDSMSNLKQTRRLGVVTLATMAMYTGSSVFWLCHLCVRAFR